VAIRREAASLVISRRTMGHVRVPLAEALPGQWMAVGHDLALPSFAIGGARVHVDAEDRVFRERWRREVRFGALEVTMPPRLQLAKWTCALDAAARVAEATVPLSSSLFGGIVRTVVPIISPDPEMGCSLSDRDMPGAIMTTIDRPAVLAENILHEFRHNLLHQIEQAYPLYLVDSPEEARFYSPWRPDPRPLHGILHALFVFLDVCAVHAGVRTAALGGDPDMHDSAVRLAANVRRIGIALQEFRAHARTTEFGTGFVEGIEEAVGRFLPLVAALPTEALQEADGLVEQHRANWTGVG
jgi:HEXXH motif-containing protein